MGEQVSDQVVIEIWKDGWGIRQWYLFLSPGFWKKEKYETKFVEATGFKIFLGRRKMRAGKEDKKGRQKDQMLKYWLIKVYWQGWESHVIIQHLPIYISEVLACNRRGSLTGSWSQLSSGWEIFYKIAASVLHQC